MRPYASHPAMQAADIATVNGQAEFSLPPHTALLDEPLTALFCSNRCPGDLILKTYDIASVIAP